jgi:asparagine synthase (glutamine-hydrolysing)
MCGIAGFIMRDAPPEQDLLGKMAQCLAHRGPDGQRTKIIGPVALAHTRLSIIDLEGGWQPLHDADERYWVIANGEIYNYIELTEELTRRGRRFLTHSDSESILHAYAEFGPDFLKRLNGMFAFALYDAHEKKLILARDRLGIKPLYYVELPDRIAFASEIRALLPLLPREPNLSAPALLEFMLEQHSIGEHTFVDGIKRLAPGTALEIDAECRTRAWRYWSTLDVAPRHIEIQDAFEEFDALMQQVMREHIRSDVPYGLFLSAGVDSGILAALLRRYQDQPLRTFTMGFRDVKIRDELEGAERASKLLGTSHTPVFLDQTQFWRRMPHMVWATDELMRDYACLPTAFLAQAASKELKVVFSGEGGDEAFAGYGRYRTFGLRRFFKKLIKPETGGFRVSKQWDDDWSKRLFAAELAEAARNAKRSAFAPAWESSPSSWGFVRRAQHVDLVTALPDNLLVKMDRMLMAFGVEGRVPYLDHRVVEFGLSLPEQLKATRRKGKVFLRQWGEQFLPKEHLDRRKSGFTVPVTEWLRGPMLDSIVAALMRNRLIRAWFKPEGIQWLASRQQHAAGDVSNALWCLMQCAMWYQIFVERPGSIPTLDENLVDWIAD